MLVARVTIGPGRWSKRGRRRVWEAKGVQPVTSRATKKSILLAIYIIKLAIIYKSVKYIKDF